LSDAITSFQAQFPPQTRESLVREYIRSEQAQRAAAVAGGVPRDNGARPGPSHLDRMLFSKNNSGPTARDRGYGGGYRRGAFPSSMRGAKLPSQK